MYISAVLVCCKYNMSLLSLANKSTYKSVAVDRSLPWQEIEIKGGYQATVVHSKLQYGRPKTSNHELFIQEHVKYRKQTWSQTVININ